MTRDKAKFEECITVYEDRKQRLTTAIAVTNDEIQQMSGCASVAVGDILLTDVEFSENHRRAE